MKITESAPQHTSTTENVFQGVQQGFPAFPALSCPKDLQKALFQALHSQILIVSVVLFHFLLLLKIR